MVAAGLGVTILPRLAIAPYVQTFDLVSIKLTDSWAIRQLSICVRSDHALHPAAQLFLDHARR
jgi:DNA-binding transcriptional LysR family regulator